MPDKSVSLSLVRGLTASEVSRLKKAGIDSTGELLAAAKTPSQERALASKAGLTLDRTREAVNRADLIRLNGMGPATADLFENAGVNSVKELAQRNAAALAVKLKKYVATHPELNYRLPSPTTVASLVAKAKQLTAPTPVTPTTPTYPTNAAEAKTAAAAQLHSYIDTVLFSNDPAGASFREAVLDWRPSPEWDAVKAKMHASVESFLGANNVPESELEELYDKPQAFTFAGRLYGLYTEVTVPKSADLKPSVYVEID